MLGQKGWDILSPTCGQKGPRVSLAPLQVYLKHRGSGGSVPVIPAPPQYTHNFDSLHVGGTLLWSPISCRDLRKMKGRGGNTLGYPPHTEFGKTILSPPLSYISLLGVNLCLRTAEESHASREVSFSQELGR